MATQSITVELDDETISGLAELGTPIDVLAHLARHAIDIAHAPPGAKRELTDESLRVERDKADTGIANEQMTADEVVRVARQRADRLVRTSQEAVDREQGPPSETSALGSARARTRVESERADADAALERERAARKLGRAEALATERGATDKDLTGERALADQVLVDQREANEHMVHATIRAHELANEAEVARERAEGNERELRTMTEFREMFIGILGHDLRNPLAAIVMSAATLLRRGHLDEQDAETAARIIRASQRMTRMIAQVLDLTRARLGGGLPIERKPTDLRDVCQTIVEEFDAPIQLELEGDDLTGNWDEDRLAEVLSNLAGNAVRYATPGTAVIVRARTDGAEVVVEVTNQGEAIREDQLPFLFEPFRRAEELGAAKSGNLGLGLYIAHQIVLAHGGGLEVRSANGTTTFAMRLPRGVAP
jgi:signal transduction histidine kinase